MDRKRLLRNPLIWILAAVLVFFAFSVLFDDTRGFTQVDTSAAVVVTSGDEFDEWAVTDALASLVDKSMLASEAGPDHTTSYSMLETLRQYAREQERLRVHTQRS